MFEETKLPAPTGVDRFRTALKALAGGGWVGLTAEGIDQIIGSVHRSQYEKFVDDLAERLKDLEKSSLTIEDVFSNPKFYDAVFYAATAAAKTSREEKRKALSNAVLNSVLPGSPDEDLQQIFIGYVERLTPSHLKILRLVVHGVAQKDPIIYASTENARPLHQILQREHPELLTNGGLLQLVCDDLESLGLIKKPGLGRGEWPGLPLVQITPTGFATEFLKFISEPEGL